jgi:pimeloyl-ACP methyl ester carboxylesterase
MRNFASWVLVGASLAIATGTTDALAQTASPPGSDPSLAPYASTKDSVRLPDGRTIHMVCMGQGSPVVILTPGAGEWSAAWNKVQPSVARKTRVCAWDRAAFGLSSPSPLPQTVDNRTDDLQAALAAGKIAGPYVVVGHSLGGFETLLLKDREPTKVVGMVLVDIAYPDEFTVAARVAPRFIAWVHSRPSPLVDFMHTCATGLRAGTVGYGKPDPAGCTRPPRPQTFPPELREALDKAQLEAGPETLAGIYENQSYYNQSYLSERDSRIAVNPRRNYGSMPLVVLTAGEDAAPPPDLPADIKPELPLQAAEWRRAQDALAALSTRGVNRVVAGSTHPIHQIKPQVVIDAIDEVVDAARADKR